MWAALRGPIDSTQIGTTLMHDLVLGPDLERQYSLCGDPTDLSSWRLGVLREPESRGGSAHVHERLAVGDQVVCRGPRNNFALVEAADYLFVAGGIGITPILPMIAACEAAGKPWRLFYGGRHESTMAFRGELAAYGERVTFWPQYTHGILDLATILGTPAADTAIYCCSISDGFAQPVTSRQPPSTGQLRSGTSQQPPWLFFLE